MRSIETAATNVLSGPAVALAELLTMEFTGGTLRVNTTKSDLKDFDSPPNTYVGVGVVGRIEQVEDKAQEVTNLRYTLSGVDTGLVALALGEQVRGRPMRLDLAVMDPDTKEMLDVVPVFAGTMSTIGIVTQSGLATIVITIEHRGVLFSRSRPVRYTDADQQRLYPGDRCLEFIVSQSQTQDIWPAASFSRQ